MALDVTLLGPVVLRVDGEVVPLPPGRPLVLLVALLLGRGRRVSTDRLVEALWDGPPGSVASNLRTYTTRLRHLLGPHSGRLVRLGDGYALTVEPGELDLDRWEHEVAEAHRTISAGMPEVAADRLRAALALWTGNAAEPVARRGAVGRGLDALDEARLAATESYARACIDAGRYPAAVDCLQPFVVEHPDRERAWHQLMLARFQAGDRVAALATYAAARSALIAEVGVEPGGDLQALHRRLLDDPAPPSSAPAVRTLPPDTDLVGRAGLLAEVVETLADPARPAIVALHGPAGVGKSALAIRAAWALADRYPGGQLYVDLRGNSPGLAPMPPTEALGYLLRALTAFTAGESMAAQVARLRGLLAEHAVLLVLDNVVDAAQLRPLLPAVAGSAVLVTSRRMLATVDADRHVPVGELDTAAALSMLARYGGGTRVAEAEPDARLLSQLCDHLPLALRIVGARLAGRPDWTLRAMVSRLADERHRLDELACDDLAVRSGLALTCGTLAERPGGAAALRLFDRWGAASVSVLGLELARVLSGDGVAGDREAGDGVAAARAALDRLAEARLIEPVGDDRYRMHDLVRIYALERADQLPADERAAAVHRLRCHYLATTRQARDLVRVNVYRIADEFTEHPPLITFAGKKAALDWLELERVNLVTAAGHAAREGSARGDLFAARLAGELYPFLPMRGHYQDWRRLSEDALACARRIGSQADEVVARTHLANAQARTGNPELAVRTLREALIGTSDLRLIATVHDHLGVVLAADGDLAGARESFQRSAALHRARPHPHDLGVTLNNLADVHLQLGETTDALRHLQESLRLRRGLDDQLGIGITTLTIGQVFAHDRRYPEALDWLGRALAGAREHGNREAEWRALMVRADVHVALGDAAAAHQDLAAALAVGEQIGDPAISAQARQALDDLATRSGTP